MLFPQAGTEPTSYENGIMPQCSACGSEESGRFCMKCGAPVKQPEPPPPSPLPPQAASADLPENVVNLLCYAFGVLSGVLFLVLEPYSKNPAVRFHAFQSLFFSGAAFIVWFVLLLVSAVLAFIPWVGAIAGSLLLAVCGLAMLAVWVVLMVKAYQGEKWKLPVIGDLAEKQAYTN